ncbi:hypothetical protein D3C87_1706820 [compost metagenome]
MFLATTDHRRGYIAGTQIVDSDVVALAGAVCRRRTSKDAHTAFAGIVGRHHGFTDDPLDGGDIDDRASSSLHRCDGLLSTDEHRIQVHRIGLAPLR